MPDLWKLTPSDLTFLWDECPRCFYLKTVHGIKRPRVPFPKIFTTIDGLMKSFFHDKQVAELTPDLPEGIVRYGEQNVVSRTISLPGHEAGCFLRGRFDAAVAFEDGTYGVVDFKTTTPSPEHIPFYSRQLHAYAYALEHPLPGSFSLKPVTRLGLLCVEPEAMVRTAEGHVAYLGEVTWLEVSKNQERFMDFLDQVLGVLERPLPPPSGIHCSYCRYRDQARSSGL